MDSNMLAIMKGTQGCLCGAEDEGAPLEHVKSFRAYLLKKPFMHGESGKDVPVRLGFFHLQATHSGEKPHRSTKCREAFSHSSSLKQQQGVHARQDPFRCSNCGKAFLKAFALLDHLITHSEKRSNTCPTGRNASKDKSILRVHTGERPFECNQCGKTYVTHSGLYQHWKVHTGERPYECSLCGKAFTTRSYRNRHQQFHTEERLYECTECGKAFKHSSTLLQHKKVHSGERP